MADFTPGYGFGAFGPEQYSNPYSLYQNSALPWPSSYVGWPTDSMGAPIQPQPGMTINSQPQAAQPQPAAPQQQTVGQATLQALGIGNLTNDPQKAQVLAQMVMGGASPNAVNMPLWGGQQQAAPATPAPASNPGGLSAQSYLSLLAHPNQVTTPGATVPQAAQSYQPGPGVLQQFLANWKPAQSGPGSGFAKSFAKNLGG